ncbi:hypothetical protein ATM17_04485 [Sphingopyxis macrogoltabida]|uniref:Uncharacterized protein n=1 Tax=Sphingopyxis macrogoltabida TaxID=33050 RepID=A0AAC8YXY1_SPHMC|nr:hypothetical protein ATM17_04485 [Sphingopyxis macrogoltabida]
MRVRSISDRKICKSESRYDRKQALRARSPDRSQPRIERTIVFDLPGLAMPNEIQHLACHPAPARSLAMAKRTRLR